MRTGFIISVIPGIMCVGGVYFFHIGIITAGILYNLCLMAGVENAMLPKLKALLGVAVTHFAVMVLIVTFLGNSKRVLKHNSNRGRANNTALHRTPKASAFFTSWQIIG
ncbi:MAG: hypothetical protein OMM_09960 [Candidatus Magnetoglobus multicellularis str. Araruama]|uniref:Uncharacterized protein n=1 Tax=Candidatus Magnetoglobus multicellularis str. Araruama TaxID=890399 RepID=A0A1V1P2A1_9BACT|nr:MAG: hypothetical protein OMM_09960 [Candidatus Magnetoglobus multicellularis str. Araruama]